jgi:hypothetical protein
LVVVIQLVCPFVLVVSHQRAARLDDQLAGSQRGIGFAVRQVDEYLVDAQTDNPVRRPASKPRSRVTRACVIAISDKLTFQTNGRHSPPIRRS